MLLPQRAPVADYRNPGSAWCLIFPVCRFLGPRSRLFRPLLDLFQDRPPLRFCSCCRLRQPGRVVQESFGKLFRAGRRRGQPSMQVPPPAGSEA